MPSRVAVAGSGIPPVESLPKPLDGALPCDPLRSTITFVVGTPESEPTVLGSIGAPMRFSRYVPL
jgi:hypothetical protein